MSDAPKNPGLHMMQSRVFMKQGMKLSLFYYLYFMIYDDT